ncbi:hypothetical protein [Hydrocarboniphaga sp.]|uniref:hypothetical protein n=1 Tax=Hydrocarboniphaga sp. TaxID=2033016 RepID=UPI002612A58B|nr:hypothetical protein [Hydrocarboniphaga sp.]
MNPIRSKWYESPSTVILVIATGIVLGAFILWAGSCALAAGTIAAMSKRTPMRFPAIETTVPSSHPQPQIEAPQIAHYERAYKQSQGTAFCFAQTGRTINEEYLRCAAFTFLRCTPEDLCRAQRMPLEKDFR